MPHRVIRDGFIRSHSLQQVSRDARLTMALLILAVDDHGRMEASQEHLKADLYPLDVTVTGYQITEWIAELAKQGSVAWYEDHGRCYLYLPHWDKHDSKRRKCASELPEPPMPEQHTVEFPKVSEMLENTTGGVGVGVGVGVGSRSMEQERGEGVRGGGGLPGMGQCLPGCERYEGHGGDCATKGESHGCWDAIDPVGASDRRAVRGHRTPLEAAKHPPKKPKPRPPKKPKRAETEFPEVFPQADFDRLRHWGEEQSPRLECPQIRHALDAVRDWAKSNGKRKADWVATVRGAIRDGWALRGTAAADGPEIDHVKAGIDRLFEERRKRNGQQRSEGAGDADGASGTLGLVIDVGPQGGGLGRLTVE